MSLPTLGFFATLQNDNGGVSFWKEQATEESQGGLAGSALAYVPPALGGWPFLYNDEINTRHSHTSTR